ncbi:MAG: GGDEF domain-containing protein [Gammaproteobacteria bacterium]|nr:GGDEF domain-containing protein [Gammaproteobacteria bacterium]
MSSVMQRRTQRMETDPITGLPGRGCFYELGRKELSFAQRFGIEIAVLLIQVDNFEQIIQNHGGPVAKQVLRKLAKYIEAAISPEDTVTRLGTCCFAVVAESIGNVTIKQTATKIIDRVRHTRFVYNDEKLRFTVSIGIGAPSGQLVNKFEDVVELVGQRMLVASASGGNRIVF